MLLAALAIALAGCDEDFLVRSNPNELTTGGFWKSADDAQRATNAAYESMTYEGMYMRMMHVLQDFRGDDTAGTSPWAAFQFAGEFRLRTTEASPAWAWRDAYQGVYRTNQVLHYVPAIDMDAALKERLMAEARFLRAFYYFHLVKMFNNVPLVLTPSVSDGDYFQPQASPADVWNQIGADLQLAQAALPRSYGKDTGRATWGAATAYLGVAHLFNRRWQDADAEFRKVIDSGLYRLVPDPRDNGSPENENNAESIFEIQFSREVGGSLRGGAGVPGPDWSETHARSDAYAPAGFGRSDAVPTRGLYEAFKSEPTVDGRDDPRLYATMFYNRPGMTVYGVPFEEAYASDLSQVFWRKYESDTPGGHEHDARSDINIRVMRYADILLMYAETRNELGDQAAAARFVQMVRNRAGLPDREAEFASLSQGAMRDRIAAERYLELAGEGKRFDDIRRWGWLEDPARLAELVARDDEFAGYIPGREWLPIPQAELDTNPQLEQNPSY